MSIDLLIESLWIYHADPTDLAKYFLIQRYKDKVSQRLIKEQKIIYERMMKEGKETAQRLMRELVMAPNSVLSQIPKSEGFSGKYLPVPLIL